MSICSQHGLSNVIIRVCRIRYTQTEPALKAARYIHHHALYDDSSDLTVFKSIHPHEYICSFDRAHKQTRVHALQLQLRRTGEVHTTDGPREAKVTCSPASRYFGSWGGPGAWHFCKNSKETPLPRRISDSQIGGPIGRGIAAAQPK